MDFSFAVTGMSIGMPFKIDFGGILLQFCLNSSIRPQRAVSIEKTLWFLYNQNNLIRTFFKPHLHLVTYLVFHRPREIFFPFPDKANLH